VPPEAQIIIRRYREEDRDAVNGVALAAFAQYANDYHDWPAFRANIGRTADLAQQADLLVADVGGAIAGAIAHVGPDRPRSPIYPPEWSVVRMLVVDPARRGQGVGRALARWALLQAIECDLAKLYVEVVAEQEGAVAMFSALGFTAEGLLRDHVRDRDGELRDLILLSHSVEDAWSAMETAGIDDALA